MTSYLRNNESRTRSKSLLIGVVVLILIAFVPFVRRGLSSILISIQVPIWRTAGTLGRAALTPVRYLRVQSTLLKENELLRMQVSSHASKDALLAAASQENAELLRLLGRRPAAPDLATSPSASHWPHAGSGVLAVIISRPAVSIYDSLIIDRGSAHGIQPGSAVFSPEGILLGMAETVFARETRVALLSSTGRMTPVVVGKEHLATVAEGVGGGNFSLKVAHGAPIARGDIVQVPHDTPWVIGTVGAIDSAPDNMLARIFVKASVNFQQMKWVIVTKDAIPTSKANNNPE